ncbi:MAG: CBS domain-containing protein [Pseudomonadota bacterium]
MEPTSLLEMISDMDVHTVHPDDTVRSACLTLSAKSIGALPVVQNDGRLVGILSERDVLRRSVVVYRPPEKTTVSEIMTRDPICLPPDAHPSQALDAMQKGKFRHVPVCEDGMLLGIVSIRDFDIRREWEAHAENPTLRIA